MQPNYKAARIRLEAMLDARLSAPDVILRAPNAECMRGFSPRDEAEKMNEAENAIRDAKIIQWLGENACHD
jgi:hypothetical protein